VVSCMQQKQNQNMGCRILENDWDSLMGLADKSPLPALWLARFGMLDIPCVRLVSDSRVLSARIIMSFILVKCIWPNDTLRNSAW
jgi:hypothetical protein